VNHWLRVTYAQHASQLEQTLGQIFEVCFVELPKAVVVHDADENGESFFLWHVEEEGGGDEGETLAVAHLEGDEREDSF
jgi:hypothetical protein